MEVAPLRVGLIGLGAIGQQVARLLHESDAGREITLVAALVRDAARSRPPGSPPLVTSCGQLLALRPNIIVEAAGHDALREHGPRILEAGCELLALSVGALAEPDTEAALLVAARTGRAQLRVLSGAIGALDAIAAAAVGGLERVTHTTRKPARALLPPAEADALTEPQELFRGSAREGALRFPESINVAAAVSLAGIGLDRTEVRVIADNGVTRNRHEVVAEGAFGTLRFTIEGVPSAENPKTGRLVAMSVVHALRARRAPLVIG